jgi:hypothetical protein
VVVVLGAAADETVTLHPQGIGVGIPQGQISGGHDIKVGKDPDLFGPLPRQPGHQVGAFTPRHPGVRGRVVVHLEAPAGQEVQEKSGLLPFPGTALVRAHGHPTDQFPLEADQVFLILAQAFGNLLELLLSLFVHIF